MCGVHANEPAIDRYDRYIRAEWAMFSADPGRTEEASAAVAGMPVARVLDVGCGAGQELRPFLREPHRLGVGVDLAPSTGRAGRELFRAEQPQCRVAFVRATAERLPFGPAAFDVVICRLALPYTDNTRTIAEISRVLRPGGALLLKFHHARYYTDELARALARGEVKSAIHALRVLVAGTVYHLTGTQVRSRLTGNETYQSMWLLRREFRRHGLTVRRLLRDSVPAAPNVLVTRDA